MKRACMSDFLRSIFAHASHVSPFASRVGVAAFRCIRLALGEGRMIWGQRCPCSRTLSMTMLSIRPCPCATLDAAAHATCSPAHFFVPVCPPLF
jgi:hypothetical protein